MRAAELAPEGARVEALGPPALFALDQRRANGFDLCISRLLSPNEITDGFLIVGVVATFDQRLDSVILLVGHCNGLTDYLHGKSPNSLN
jgi:hypothetical protein